MQLRLVNGKLISKLTYGLRLANGKLTCRLSYLLNSI